MTEKKKTRAKLKIACKAKNSVTWVELLFPGMKLREFWDGLRADNGQQPLTDDEWSEVQEEMNTFSAVEIGIKQPDGRFGVQWRSNRDAIKADIEKEYRDKKLEIPSSVIEDRLSEAYEQILDECFVGMRNIVFEVQTAEGESLDIEPDDMEREQLMDVIQQSALQNLIVTRILEQVQPSTQVKKS